MSSPSTAASGVQPSRRRYDSPIRRKRTTETRERIVSAGSALAHKLLSWDWRELTFRAVAERAGVSERTVYRHFPSERELHDAVMHRLEEEAGVSYEDITIDRVSEVAGKVFASLSAFGVAPPTMDDPTFVDEDQRRRNALLGAVTDATPDWTDRERRAAAAILDVLWNVYSYERLITAWQLDGPQATQAIDWSIRLIVAAIRDGTGPGSRTGRRR
jgi:AcrR family transcriptional regulator